MVNNDKRKAVRVPKRLEVKFHSTAENTAITNDLSENGLFITTSKGIDAGSPIDIKLHLPNSDALFIKGRVVRNLKAMQGVNNGAQIGMGIELINPPVDFINYIQSLLHS
ncbi:MAG: PilZ domain-containing protein [Nitrospirae bacterium]|nr:PilZ domain-containing protein [Nitrospirota bacterium]